MITEKKIFDEIKGSQLKGRNIHLSNSLINTLNFEFFEIDYDVIIENCIINNFLIHSCWFKKGLTFKNNHVINYVDYQMGGHNEKPINIEGNIFCEYVNFYDCHFNSEIILKQNIFLKGSNLLGNTNEGFHNIFENNIISKDNIGDLSLDGLGR